MGNILYIQKPMRRTIFSNNSNKTYFLSFPYVLFKINYYIEKEYFVFNYLQVGFSTSAKLSLKRIFRPALSNITENLTACIAKGNLVTKHNNIEDLKKYIVEKFWNSIFNYELDYGKYYYKNSPIFKSYDAWEEKTKKFPKWKPLMRELIPVVDHFPNFFDYLDNVSEL